MNEILTSIQIIKLFGWEAPDSCLQPVLIPVLVFVSIPVLVCVLVAQS